MGEGAALGSAGGRPQADRGRHRKGEEEVAFVVPGRLEEANPEPRDSGFDASHRPGMTKPHTPGFGRPAIAQAARSVFTSRQVTVFGPTPPGTGVIAPATSRASLNATSPTSRVLPSAAGTRLMPTSMTVAPGLIQSPRTISGLPTAAYT